MEAANPIENTAPQSSPPPVPNLYSPVHRGLRRAFARACTQAGAAVWGEDRGGERALDAIARLLRLLRTHASREDRFIHPVARVVAPEVAAALDADHAGQGPHLAELEAAMKAYEAAPASDRKARGEALAMKLQALEARELAHMLREETELMPVLAARVPAPELAEIQRATVASLDVEELAASLEEMLPALSPAERVLVLGGVRRARGDASFEEVAARAMAQLEPREAALLAEAVGLPWRASPMRLWQVDFRSPGPWGAELAAAVCGLAEEIANAEGLVWKLWTEAPKAGLAGGVYLFANEACATAYLELHRKRLEAFGVSEVRARVFEVNVPLSKLDRASLA